MSVWILVESFIDNWATYHNVSWKEKYQCTDTLMISTQLQYKVSIPENKCNENYMKTLHSESQNHGNQFLSFTLFCHSGEFCRANTSCWYISVEQAWAIFRNIISSLFFLCISPCSFFDNHLDQLCSRWKSHRYTIVSVKQNTIITIISFTHNCILLSCWQKMVLHKHATIIAFVSRNSVTNIYSSNQVSSKTFSKVHVLST